ncbi:MAG: hydrogenase maturation protease [Planctomycetota bacterium]|nr:hydrogenase maturation protease [Planctomycetota bacterium]
MKTLVLGLGNDILADDAVGVLAARALADRSDDTVEVRETAEHGMALLDHLIGYERVILIDAIQTGSNEPGTILEIDPASLSAVYAPSPHYSGLPELLAVAERLELDFPTQFRIFAVEIADALTIGGAITPAVREAIPELCDRVRAALDEPV